MSKIEANVCEVTELKIKRGEDRQDYLKRIGAAAADLNDDDWNDLTKEAQNWVNSVADAINANAQKVPDFPDLAKEEAPARSRRASKEEAPAAPSTKEIDVDDIDVGMALKLVTKRGKEFTGHVTEAGKDEFTLKLGNGDLEDFDYDRIDKVWTLADGGASDEPEGPADPQVGDTVKVVNKRGKVFEGELTEITDDIVVVGDDEIARDRVESIEVIGGKPSKKADKAPEKEEGRSRRGAKDKDADKGDDEKPKRSSNPAGVSVGGRIREIMCAKGNEDITLEEVEKMLTKEGVQFRDTSSRMIYKDVKHVLDLLKEAKRLK